MNNHERKLGKYIGKRTEGMTNHHAVEMVHPNPRNIMRALWSRFRVEPRNIRVDEIVDELGLCTGEDRDLVRQKVIAAMASAQVPTTDLKGQSVYFPEAI